MIKELILRAVSQRNGEKVFYYLVICMDMSYMVNSYSKFNNTYKQDEIIQMLNFFFIDNTFVQFGELVFQQTIGIPMETNYSLLFVNLFLHAYEVNFAQVFLKNEDK